MHSGTKLLVLAVLALCLHRAAAHCNWAKLNQTRMTELCSSGPTSSSAACTIFRKCNDASINPPLFYQTCNISVLATTLCLDDASVVGGVDECTHWMEHTSESVVTDADKAACWQQLGVYTSIMNSTVVRTAARANCQAMGNSPMDGCSTCVNDTQAGCPDPFDSLSRGCIEMQMSQCSTGGWTSFCSAGGGSSNGMNGIAAGVLCLAAADRVPAPPAPVAAPSDSGAVPQCVTKPSDASCSSYTYPESSIMADINNLCTAMPDMPGCSIKTQCNDGKLDSKWCAPMTLLATLCAAPDMSSMGGCSNYNQLCASGSVVPQCSQYPAIPNTPTWTSSRQAVFTMCGEMGMEQCSQCTQASCQDPLATLSAMCAAMPTMSQCSVLTQWCAAVGSGMDAYCSSSSSSSSSYGLPSMLMYFHERFPEIVLWRNWVPRTRGQYTGTVIAVLLMGAVSMGLKTLSAVLAMTWKHQATAQARAAFAAGQAPSVRSTWYVPVGSQWWHNLVKGLIMAVATCLDYFNMLIAMTFNVGLFVAVILGYALGTMLFTHVPENWAAQLAAAKNNTAAAHQMASPASIDAKHAALGLQAGSSGSSDQGDVEDAQQPSCCPHV